MRPLRILLDLDCVLADFIGAACRVHGFTVQEVRRFHPLGHYGLDLPLGLAKGLGRGMTAEEFWEPINRGPGFWEGLKPLPWAQKLADAVRAKTDDWWIITSPSRCPTCVYEKTMWLARFFGTGRWFDRMEPVTKKSLLAKPGVVLIDDFDHNVDEFRSEGGQAILFPAWHNVAHRHHANPLPSVLEQLRCI